MACFVKAYRDQQLNLLKKQAKPKPARKIKPITSKVAEEGQNPTAANEEADEDHHELIQEQQADLNMESTNKVIFELSSLI